MELSLEESGYSKKVFLRNGNLILKNYSMNVLILIGIIAKFLK
jgi:hypothetical protein